MPDNREIERKFLLNVSVDAIREKYRSNCASSETIEQCYLADTGEWTIRLRRAHEQAADYPRCYLTMKRKVTDLTCRELETEINWREFDRLQGDFSPKLKKIRLYVLHGSRSNPRMMWSIDRFTNPELNGLTLAELELSSEEEQFNLPEWCGEEVTFDPAYRNFNLMKRLLA